MCSAERTLRAVAKLDAIAPQLGSFSLGPATVAFIQRALEEVEGVVRSRICHATLCGSEGAASPNCCGPCPVLTTAPDALSDWSFDSCQAALSFGVPIANSSATFGGIWVDLESQAFEDRLRPFLHNFADTLALQFDARQSQWAAQQRAARLETSENLLLKTGRIAKVGGWELLPDKGMLTWSEMTRLIHGVPSDFQPKLESAIEFYAPESRPIITAAVQRALEHGDPFDLELTIINADGQAIPVRARGEVDFVDGVPVRLSGTFQDIRDEKAAERERERLQARLREAQKLESLGVLAGGIAHDFNNILAAVLGYASLAETELPQFSDARKPMGEIRRAARRASELCRQLLAYSGRGQLDVGPVDLSALVEEMTQMLSVSISKTVVMNLRLSPMPTVVLGDSTQLRQVIMNLVINASEAIGGRSGVVTISTGLVDCTSAYIAQTFPNDAVLPGMYAYLEVADTGVGMSKEVADCIFDPFYTTKFTGRGLGLAAVLGIVRGHGGTIKVYTEPGRGTSFKVLLPWQAEDNAMSSEETASETCTCGGTGLVLLVDDDETIRAMAKAMLEHIGFSVLSACDGREAVEVYGRHSENIRLVLMDLTMPHMGGEEAFRRMRIINPDLPVIIASGYNAHDLGQLLAGRPKLSFLNKPFDMSTLHESIDDLLGE